MRPQAFAPQLDRRLLSVGRGVEDSHLDGEACALRRERSGSPAGGERRASQPEERRYSPARIIKGGCKETMT